jgi:hypothetical protein
MGCPERIATGCIQPSAADLSLTQVARERSLMTLMFLLQPEVISSAAAY